MGEKALIPLPPKSPSEDINLDHFCVFSFSGVQDYNYK